MKQFLFGVVFTIFAASILNNHWMAQGKYSKLAFYITQNIIMGNYIIHPGTGRCSSTQTNGRGIIEADYFQCDKFQRLINRE